MPSAPPTPFDTLLEYLKMSRGFDFTGYKRTTLERRVTKRMQQVEVADETEYRDYLELHPDEFSELFNTILINVTTFFRDAPVWEHVRTTAIPALLEAAGDSGPIRVWCAGCSSGEEPYTVAILLAEALGLEAFLARVKIYATDIDDEALGEARAAVYSDKAVEGVSPELLERYFERSERRYVFRKDLRRAVIFGRNDLVQDAPISRIDLLTCRNTLMYFNAETQARILNRLHFALNDTGVLLLGKSEMLIRHSDFFVPTDLKRRLFTKAARTSPRDRRAAPAAQAPDPAAASRLCDLAFEAALMAQVVVDADEVLVGANRQARDTLGLRPTDVGRPLRDLELSYRPADLRSNLELVTREHRTVTLGVVDHTSPTGDRRALDIHLAPVLDGGALVGATVSFVDVTVQRHLRTDLETSRAELENAYEELQSTVEELETTNEELQSTNEELETTNEEVQSTNEELETMNEELQSTNEELETMNEELRTRSREVYEVNTYLETILTAVGSAVVTVDAQLVVRTWNGQAEEFFGLRRDDVRDRPLLGLDVGLPVRELADPLRDVLRGTIDREVVELEATNRRGRQFRSRVTVLPFEDMTGDTGGAIVLIEAIEAPAALPVADGTR